MKLTLKCFPAMVWYLQKFSLASPSHQLLMEKTPHYLVKRYLPVRVAHFNPEMSLIFSLRDPLVRAVSDFAHEMAQGSGNETYGKGATIEQVLVDKYGDFVSTCQCFA